jgi:hypothetical protein
LQISDCGFSSAGGGGSRFQSAIGNPKSAIKRCTVVARRHFREISGHHGASSKIGVYLGWLISQYLTFLLGL